MEYVDKVKGDWDIRKLTANQLQQQHSDTLQKLKDDINSGKMAYDMRENNLKASLILERWEKVDTYKHLSFLIEVLKSSSCNWVKMVIWADDAGLNGKMILDALHQWGNGQIIQFLQRWEMASHVPFDFGNDNAKEKKKYAMSLLNHIKPSELSPKKPTIDDYHKLSDELLEIL
jgi:hypothetical protein